MPTKPEQGRGLGLVRPYRNAHSHGLQPMWANQELWSYLNPITDETQEKELPSTMGGVIVYHNFSRRFYSTVVNNPFDFRRKMLSYTAEYYKLAKALRLLLQQHPGFEFFYVHERARNAVENMMHSHGYRRVTTTKGEMQEEIPHLFSVTDIKNNFTRWAIAPVNIDDYYLLLKVNRSFKDWVNASIEGRVAVSEQSARERVLARLGYDFFNRPAHHFNSDEIVIRDHGQMIVSIKDYAATTAKCNDESVTEFLKG